MWPVARARAAGVLLALAVLLVPASPAGGSALSGLVGADGPRAGAAAAFAGGHPDASATQPDAGQLALLHHARQAASPLDRRADRGHFHALLVALPPAALAAALLLGLGTGRLARRRTGRPAGARSRSRAPPQPLFA
jgi:hypothetical protein